MTSKLTIRTSESADQSYPIRFHSTFRSAAADLLKATRGRPLFIITDRNVHSVYRNEIRNRILSERPGSGIFVVPAGEKTKTRRWKERIEDWLLAQRAGRDAVVVAFGGGMVGDLAGFTAATLNRGVSFIQFPTSLLAQVDSSVGAKVAVDHPLGKNLIGLFSRPAAVYIAIPLLSTLPEPEYLNGLAEVIKYGAILDRSLFRLLEKSSGPLLRRNRDLLATVVRRCCTLKKTVVEADEREHDFRRILNFGHTIGHAVELLSDYSLRHGEAVAIGMAAEARMSVRLGLLSPGDEERLVTLIMKYGLPVSLPRRMHPHRIITATLRDKKSAGEKIAYTLLRAIGEGRTGHLIGPGEAERLISP